MMEMSHDFYEHGMIHYFTAGLTREETVKCFLKIQEKKPEWVKRVDYRDVDFWFDRFEKDNFNLNDSPRYPIRVRFETLPVLPEIIHLLNVDDQVALLQTNDRIEEMIDDENRIYREFNLRITKDSMIMVVVSAITLERTETIFVKKEIGCEMLRNDVSTTLDKNYFDAAFEEFRLNVKKPHTKVGSLSIAYNSLTDEVDRQTFFAGIASVLSTLKEPLHVEKLDVCMKTVEEIDSILQFLRQGSLYDFKYTVNNRLVFENNEDEENEDEVGDDDSEDEDSENEEEAGVGHDDSDDEENHNVGNEDSEDDDSDDEEEEDEEDDEEENNVENEEHDDSEDEDSDDEEDEDEDSDDEEEESDDENEEVEDVNVLKFSTSSSLKLHLPYLKSIDSSAEKTDMKMGDFVHIPRVYVCIQEVTLEEVLNHTRKLFQFHQLCRQDFFVGQTIEELEALKIALILEFNMKIITTQGYCFSGDIAIPGDDESILRVNVMGSIEFVKKCAGQTENRSDDDEENSDDDNEEVDEGEDDDDDEEEEEDDDDDEEEEEDDDDDEEEEEEEDDDDDDDVEEEEEDEKEIELQNH